MILSLCCVSGNILSIKLILRAKKKRQYIKVFKCVTCVLDDGCGFSPIIHSTYKVDMVIQTSDQFAIFSSYLPLLP